MSPGQVSAEVQLSVVQCHEVHHQAIPLPQADIDVITPLAADQFPEADLHHLLTGDDHLPHHHHQGIQIDILIAITTEQNAMNVPVGMIVIITNVRALLLIHHAGTMKHIVSGWTIIVAGVDSLIHPRHHMIADIEMVIVVMIGLGKSDTVTVDIMMSDLESLTEITGVGDLIRLRIAALLLDTMSGMNDIMAGDWQRIKPVNLPLRSNGHPTMRVGINPCVEMIIGHRHQRPKMAIDRSNVSALPRHQWQALLLHPRRSVVEL